DPEWRLAPTLIARSDAFAPEHFAGTDERRRTLELLRRQQSQGVAHEHGHAVGSVVAGHSALESANGEGERGEPEVRLRLSPTCRKEEEIHEALVGAAFWMHRIDERRDVQQDERELEGTPGPLLPDVGSGEQF